MTRDRNPPGEHAFVSTGLFLSLHLGHYLRLEQKTADGLWLGTSVYGDVKVMLPGEDRTFRHASHARFAHLTIDGVTLRRVGIDQGTLRSYVLLRDRPLRHLMEALVAETGAEPVSRLFEEATALAIATRLAALNGHAPAPAPRRLDAGTLARTIELIEDCLDTNLSIQDLAHAAHMSPSHFTALFTASVGEPPHRYQIRRRVERARELLRQGRMPADAAIAVGFYDQSHLARHMRRLLGVSPTAFRTSRSRSR